VARALITGVTGQDGAYLSQLLLDAGHTVYGTHRPARDASFWRLRELGIATHANLHLVEFDVTDLADCIALMHKAEPDFVFNLAAQSFVASSFAQPTTIAHVTGIGALNLLEAIRLTNPKTRFYQASSSELFGLARIAPQREDTPFTPRNPYGTAKLYAHWITSNYRENYGIFAATGILFNHESPLRGPEFVTRKITDSVAKIAYGIDSLLTLGNLSATRDWGYAKEYVEGMWQMLQTEKPEVFVLSTGRSETVRDFVRLAFRAIGVELEFSGSGVTEVGRVAAVKHGSIARPSKLAVDVGAIVVTVSPQFYRPAEAMPLVGDASKALSRLGWRATTTLETMCSMMVEADLRRNGTAPTP
jgi:GDPmannose 4,6-dehydratase